MPFCYNKSTVESDFACALDITTLVPLLKDKGYTIYGIEQKPNQLIPYHEHSAEEMVIVISGRVRYIIEEEIVDVRAGEVIRIYPNTIHSTISIYDRGPSNILLTFV